MEIWDVLDSDGNLIQKTISSEDETALGEGMYHLGADVWIINSENKILIQKRSKKKKNQPGVWAMTGGSVIKGETSLEAIKREVKEELGIELDTDKAIKIKHYRKGNVWLDEYLVKQNIDLNNVVLQEEEVCEVRFATFNEIENLLQCKQFITDRWEYVRNEIKKFIKNKQSQKR